MQQQFISDNQSLVELCQQLQTASVLAVDTEFVRTRTLYPKLGLLQVCDGNTIALIDPIKIDDLSPFWQLLADKNITKVLHACSEDLEVFLHAGNCKPENLIDSQIMMAFLGHGISLGYAAMVQHFLNIELDKSESRTDWTKRPLSEKQLTYAAADVEHLYQLFPALLKEVTESGWLAAVQEESQLMIERKFTAIDTSTLYRNVKLASKLNSIQLNRLKQLAIWRYEQAKQRDLPLGFIAKDNTLIGLAECNPSSIGAMSSIEGGEVLDIRHKGKAMLQVLAAAAKIPAAEHPKRIQRLDQYPGYKQVFKHVKSFLTNIAEQSHIGMENLASKKQINQYLSCYYQLNDTNASDVDLMNGWRKAILGDRLDKFAQNKFK
ncbi:ribonuclease D [Thalassotalea agariperforans]